MKKIILILIGFFTLITVIYSCEKDDICPTDSTTTPLLIITFYDISNREESKDVIALRILAGENDGVISTFTDRKNTDSIAIPLRSFHTSTSFKFIFDSEDVDHDDDELTPSIESGNIDIVTFNYENQEVFVSRGCGFVNNYNNLTGINSDEDDPWIRSIEIANPLVKV